MANQMNLTGGVGGLPLAVSERRLLARVAGIGDERMAELLRYAQEQGRGIIDLLVDRAGADEGRLLGALAGEWGLEAIDEPREVEREIVEQVPASLTTRYRVIPLGFDGAGRLQMAWSDPFDWERWDELAQILDKRLVKVLCPRPVVEKMLTASYGLGAETVEHLVGERTDLEVRSTTAATDLSEEQAANEPTVVNLVNRIISEAIRMNATDIHFEPFEDKYRVRYRIDGVLEDVSIPASVKLLKLALVSRIKIMSNLDITEKRLPQDGRAQVSLGGQSYDLRVSILPGVFGEAVNIRIQSRGMVQLDLGRLGYEAEERAKIETLIRRPHGLVLVTGPTGSGKTTTLYTCLNRINAPEVKIITVEDPVEYWMEDILQMQVHEEIGFTFARALRSMLRHDPDVMLVGEIRDRDTADIAIRASLTGHLVFATLHTNDAASAVSRLVDIGVEPFLVATSLSGIVAQRLVRRVCDDCREQATGGNGSAEAPTWRGAGCERCRFTGYHGRAAMAEVLTVTPALRGLIERRATADEIKKRAVDESMRTLRQNAELAVSRGLTSEAEMHRVSMEE